MELTLKKARKLEGKIQATMNELRRETTVGVRAKSTNPMVEVDSAKKILLKSLTEYSRLNTARFSIRQAIGEVNQKVGINALMNERERLLADLADTTRLLSATVASPEEVADLLDAKRAQLSNGQESYRLQVTVDVPVLSKEDIEEFKKQAKVIKSRIEETEDELLQKNAGAKVTLSEGVVATLRAHALV